MSSVLLKKQDEILTESGSARAGTTTMIQSSDGFPLVVEHFSSNPSRPLDMPPIVLCPGFGGNRFNFDLDERHSLALYLADEGFDVWIAELRGYGRSKPKSGLLKARMPSWNMDDHIEKDVPAILEAITTLSGYSRVMWMGHSLGGMVAYCVLARHPQYARFFSGLITIGSPAHVEREMGRLLLPAAILFLRVLRKRGTVSIRPLARIVCSSTGRRIGLTRFWRRWANPKNVDQTAVAGTVRVGLESLSLGTLYQWLNSMRVGSLLNYDGSFDYFNNIEKIDIPVLLISGTDDRIAPAHTIRAVFDRVRSEDKTLRVFGEQGLELIQDSSPAPCYDSVDYGHEDLLIGEANRSEVFPYIAKWLRQHAESEIA